ncbi:MAG: hypothetical protein GY729_03795 [Desulfobacteraceae bacterium]|nr:hypothetical protein [Desulfobacteraceae bacterium]
MSDFQGLVLTNKGSNLIAKAQAGATINFTRIVIGDGELPEGQDLEQLETIFNHKLDIGSLYVTVLGNGSSQVRFVLTNAGVSEAFQIREVGLMAEDPDEGEILYSYANAADRASWVPAAGGTTPMELQIDLITIVGNATNITVEVGTVIFATKDDIDDHDNDPGAHAGRLSGQDMAIALSQLYAPHYAEFELFLDSWTKLFGMDNVVTSTTAESDTIQVDKTDNLIVGETYIIFDDEKTESVVVADIIDSTTVWVGGNMVNSFANAKIKRTNWTVTPGQAEAVDNGIYYASGLQLGALTCDKAVVVRRQDNDGDMELFFKDTTYQTWTPVEWSWKRERSGGMVDVEYIVPARGSFGIKITTATGQSAVDPVIQHIVFVECESGLGGIHRPPETPTIVYPASGATDIDEQPSLTTSAYIHPVETALLGSQFEISTDTDFAPENIVYDSGIVPGISFSPEKGLLSTSTTYYLRAKHFDIYYGTTDWAPVISFTTAATFVTVNQPSCLNPLAGSEVGSATGLTLISSDFDTEGGTDTHQSSQWQVALDTSFETILHDSGTDTGNLTSYNVPNETVSRSNTYYWRVRHEGAAEGWSVWSSIAMFSISALTVDDVYSTTLYAGTGDTQDIVTGLDFLGLDGLLWLKSRSENKNHSLVDTIRGMGTTYVKVIETNSDSVEQDPSTEGGITAFNDDGFTLGLGDRRYNYPGSTYVSWAFLKDVRFLDIVTYSGDGVSGLQVPFDLSPDAGMVAIKRLDVAGDWQVWHRSLDSGKNIFFNSAGTQVTADDGITSVDATNLTLGDNAAVNAVGGSYVAYVFAHDTATDGVIICSSYQGGTVVENDTYYSNTSLSNLPQNTDIALYGRGGARSAYQAGTSQYTCSTPPNYVNYPHPSDDYNLNVPVSCIPNPAEIDGTNQPDSIQVQVNISAGSHVYGSAGAYGTVYWPTQSHTATLMKHGSVTRYYMTMIAGGSGFTLDTDGSTYTGLFQFDISISYNSRIFETAYWNGYDATFTLAGTTLTFPGQDSGGSYPYVSHTINTGSSTTASLSISGGNINTSYTVSGTTDVDIGFQPQLLLIKDKSASGNWEILDQAREMSQSSTARLRANAATAEDNSLLLVEPHATGFRPNAYDLNKSGDEYIYMAIRKEE